MADLNHPEIKKWAAVDDYVADLLVDEDAPLKAAMQANQEAGLPAIDLSPVQGKFLEVLVEIVRPRLILEMGTLGGYSTLWMARAMHADSHIITLEFNPRHAQVARKNLEHAGVADRVEIRVGRALDTLPTLAAEGAGPFDLIFIDADKVNYRWYLEWALKLSHPGTTIVADNVVRDGEVANPASSDADVQGIRRMFEMMTSEPRLSGVVLQTVGAKGHDGFAVAVVRG